MIYSRRLALGLGFAALASACGRRAAYTGPEVTSVVINKGRRRIYLYNDDTVLRSYRAQLGSAPDGHKQFAGDGRTPEGQYWIDRRNPRSRYHLSLGISYPNREDRIRAAAMGKSPGGDIFIHGTPALYVGKQDWTAGCIAVSNRDIEEMYLMISDHTPVWILP